MGMSADTFSKELMAAIAEGVEKAEAEIEHQGQSAVTVAKWKGDYKNHTYTLRTSNGFKIEDGKAVLFNTAPYAKYVSAKGYDVLDSAFAYLKNQLDKPHVL